MGLAPAAAHTFGKYTLVAKLAIGGMAEIYLARLQGAGGFEKLVCIKRILPHLAKDQQLVQMFLAEAKIAAQISHPNVCQVFELGEISGSYFIAMEYLEGVPFACFRRRDLYPGDLDPRLVAGLGLQACEGLHHAHNLKRPDGTAYEVVHRDVSSNNLFATVDGVVKVLDFGIAKIQDASMRTTTGSVKGTYAYMAPEQLRGERIDRRTDVFAMGIVLWEMFGRRHLFKRDTEFLTFQAITTDPIPDVCELRPDVPPELAATIAKALARDREQRFPTARALGEALTQAVASIGGPLSASAISDEIARAFEPRLREQAALVRLAREGGALDLGSDLGPAIGHGTQLMTTPVSHISSHERTALDAPVMPARVSPPLPTAPRSATVAVSHLVPQRSRVAIVTLTIVAAGGIAVALYLWFAGPAVAPSPAIASGDPEPVRMVAVTADAAIEPPDARPPTIAIAPVDAPSEEAEVAPPVDASPIPRPNPDRPTQPDRRPPRPASGPPGFITIDSSPVYAVIYIDGKKLGETPLVRIKLAPGKHQVKAVSASGSTRSLTITIEPGKVAPTRRIEW